MRRNSRAGMLAGGGWSFSPFTRDEYQEIHRATMEVLWETGVFVGHDDALTIFGDAGASVDNKNSMVRIPEWLIQEILESAPETFVMHARNPENDFLVGGKRVGFTNFGESVLYRDPYTSEIREPSKKDLADVVKLTDYLEQVDFHHRAMVSHDKPPHAQPLHNWDAIAANTDKPFFIGPLTAYNIQKMVEMGIALAGSEEDFRSRPFFMIGTCPVSPLRLTGEFVK